MSSPFFLRLSTPARTLLRLLARLLFNLLTRWEVRGAENVPPTGAALIASNHLGHLDAPLALAACPRETEVVALADLDKVPGTRHLLRWYGVIWVRRDQLDRDVLRQALAVLAQGKPLWLAPEAGISPTGALEPGRNGVAWLAAQSGVPVVPVGITGTEQALAAWRRLRRPTITITFGPPVTLTVPDGITAAERRARLAQNTETLMVHIAALLPLSYRGAYA